MKMGDKFQQPVESVAGVLPIFPHDHFAKPQGFVQVNKYQHGPLGRSLVECIDLGENLVVNLARDIMSRMLSGSVQDPTPAWPKVTLTNASHPSYPEAEIDDPNDLFITQMRWGTGGHDPLNPATPIPPTSSDEHLLNPLVDPLFKSVIVDYPAVFQVRFSATLEQSEANGETISEVGLFTNQHELLFSRKTFGILTKSSDFSFEFRYTIIF